jgi:coatomer protein complex subunit epsilon
MSDSRTLRTALNLGLYNNVLAEAKNASDTTAKVYYYRALLETNPAEVFKQIDDRSNTGLQAVKLLGTFRGAAAEQKELAFETLREWMSDELLRKDRSLILLGSQMYFEDNNFKEAMRLVQSPGEDLEQWAMQVQIALKIDRVDLAAKACRAMTDIDDDDALSQLCNAWLNIFLGAEKATEASFLLQELIDKFGPSTKVLCLQAVCQIQLGNYSDANNYLKLARAQAITAGGKVDAAVLINYIVSLKNTLKPAEKIELELRETYPKHPWVQQQAAMSAMFDEYAARFKEQIKTK